MSSERDAKALTLTFTADLEAPPASVWRLWEDARLLERWWGPPGWPAQFVEHDLMPGGRSLYFMTGPDGKRAYGWWKVVAVDAPRVISFEDGFGDDTGAPDPMMPVSSTRVELTSRDAGTRMVISSKFESAEEMQRLLDMGMEEGMKLALGQIDAILAEPAAAPAR
jgi:uncharacterized protein YndB with AHSA1/START domain